MSGYGHEFNKGIWLENPVFKMALGLCPALAVTNSVINGVAMGLASTFVLVCSNTVVATLRNVIPSKVRIPSFIIVIASFVTIVDLTMNAYAHQMHKTLGLFIPLIVVNCLILGRSEAFASRHPILRSIVDGLGMGVGFTLALAVIGAAREILGNGTLLGYHVMGSDYTDMLVMILPPGAFLAMGVLLGIFNAIDRVRS
ncbi:MAG: electron transport complex subunit E [bacterium]|nr:MAG: electron transport complex subunit E [bacterium]